MSIRGALRELAPAEDPEEPIEEVEEAEVVELEEGGTACGSQINARRAEELWHMLLDAYERGAHTALGYTSWGAYFEAEFGQSKSRGYQLLDSGRVIHAIEGDSTIVERPTEFQARPLAPVAKEDPDAAREAAHVDHRRLLRWRVGERRVYEPLRAAHSPLLAPLLASLERGVRTSSGASERPV